MNTNKPKLRTQQLEQRALLGEVTAVFAHEVRNPINNISTGLQLMELNTPENDLKNRELISRLQKDCNRLTRSNGVYPDFLPNRQLQIHAFGCGECRRAAFNPLAAQNGSVYKFSIMFKSLLTPHLFEEINGLWNKSLPT